MGGNWRAEMKMPANYALYERMDLMRNKKQLKTVTVLSIALAVAAAVVGYLLSPIGRTFQLHAGAGLVLVKLLVSVIGMIAYIIGHEAVHGVFMWWISRVKPHFGLTLMYAYAGSDVFFAKSAYLLIAIAPVLIWGIALSVLCALVPSDWFWVVWLSQIFNLSGAAGDFYVFARVARMPSTVLVKDSGTAMCVFLPDICA